MAHVTGTVNRVGGNNSDMRVEIETQRGDIKTLSSRSGQGNQVANFVDPGKTYTFGYDPDEGPLDSDGVIYEIDER